MSSSFEILELPWQNKPQVLSLSMKT